MRDMETTLKNHSIFQLTRKSKEQIFNSVTILCGSLCFYAGVIKIWNPEKFERFQNVLETFPLIGNVAHVLSYAIPATEFIICLLLISKSTKKVGLQLFSTVMVLFTIYIIYVIMKGGDLPCLCGGMIEKLTWRQHMGFNLLFISLACKALLFNKKHN
jgi:hypothetical protein